MDISIVSSPFLLHNSILYMYMRVCMYLCIDVHTCIRIYSYIYIYIEAVSNGIAGRERADARGLLWRKGTISPVEKRNPRRSDPARIVDIRHALLLNELIPSRLLALPAIRREAASPRELALLEIIREGNRGLLSSCVVKLRGIGRESLHQKETES